MGVKLLLECLIYQILIAATLGELILPFTDLVATVTPIKPKSAALSNGEFQLPSVPNVPNLSEVILDYFISQFPETDLNLPIVCEYSSPLIVTSTSRGLPISNTQLININEPLVSYLDHKDSNFFEFSPYLQRLPYNLQCHTNFVVPNIPLPYSFSTATQGVYNPASLSIIPQYVPQNSFKDINLPCPVIPDMSILSSQLSSHTSECVSPFTPDVVVPSITVLPKLPLKCLPDDTNDFMYEPNYSNYFPIYSSPTAAQGVNPSLFHSHLTQNLFSFEALPSVDPSYSLPYPLRYELLSLPEVSPLIDIPLTVSPTYLYKEALPIKLNIKPVIKVPSTAFYPTNSAHYSPQCEKPMELIDSPNSQRIRSISSSPVMVPKNIDPYACELPNFELNPFEFAPVSFEFDSTPHFINNLDCNIEYINNFAVPDTFPVIDNFIDTLDYNLQNNFRDCQVNLDTFPIPEVPCCFPEFIPLQEICTETAISEAPSLQFSSKKIYPEACSSLIIYQPTPHTTITPCTFINLSPSPSSSQTVSTVNNMVSTVTKNLLTEFTSYLKSASAKPKHTLRSNPYEINQCKQNTCPTLSSSVSITPVSSSYIVPLSTQSMSVPTIPLNTCYTSNLISPSPCVTSIPLSSVYTEINPFYDGVSSTYPYISYLPDLSSELLEASSSSPMKVSILPPSSLSDYSSPQLCPSFLPSPIISSNIDVPYMIEPQIINLKPSNKKTKTLEKFLELIFLTELLKNNENVDCDTLDTVMALLDYNSHFK